MHDSRRSGAPPGVAFDLHFITLLGAGRRQRARCGLGCERLPRLLDWGSELGRANSFALAGTSGFALDLSPRGNMGSCSLGINNGLVACKPRCH